MRGIDKKQKVIMQEG